MTIKWTRRSPGYYFGDFSDGRIIIERGHESRVWWWETMFDYNHRPSVTGRKLRLSDAKKEACAAARKPHSRLV